MFSGGIKREQWVDDSLFADVLMDLSKTTRQDCIPHVFLAAKIHIYGLAFDTVTFVFSLLKRK